MIQLLTICTCDTPIFVVSISASLIGAINKFIFSARALQVVHVNWSTTFSKCGTAMTVISVPICAPSDDKNLRTNAYIHVGILTSSVIS